MSAGAAPGGSLGSLQEVEGTFEAVKTLPRLPPLLVERGDRRVQVCGSQGSGLVTSAVEPHPLVWLLACLRLLLDEARPPLFRM